MSRFSLFACVAFASIVYSNSRQLPTILNGGRGGDKLLGDGSTHMVPRFLNRGVEVVTPEQEIDYHGEGAETQIEIEKEMLDTSNNQHRRRKRVIKTHESQLWTGGIVPYKIASDVAQDVRDAINLAMDVIEENTCIRFYVKDSPEYTVDHASYLLFVKPSGCWSYIGRSIPGEQPISACNKKTTALHELLHALGLYHEQSHHDRDNYVQIKYKNIVNGKELNFKKVSTSNILHGTYSADSIMHYSSYSGSSNGYRTIVPVADFLSFGNSDMYWSSLNEVNTVYKCTANCDLWCKHGGYTTRHDATCQCHCIDGLDPASRCEAFLPTVHGVFVDLTLDTRDAAFQLTDPEVGETYQWIIRSPPGSQIVLDFLDLAVTGTRESCTSTLTINPGHPTDLGKVLCGYGYEKTVISESNSTILTFKVNSPADKLDAKVKLLLAEDYCYNVEDKGATYNGEVNIAEDNSACLDWWNTTECNFSPFEIRDLAADYSGNACRNPGGLRARPWCYIRKSLTGCDMKYCDACGFGRVFDSFDDCPNLLTKDPAYCTNPMGKTGCRLTCNVPQITVTSAGSCPPPNPVAGSSLTESLASSYKTGSKVTYQCDSSDIIKPRYCLSTGQWSALNAVCSGPVVDSNPDCASLSTGTNYCQTEDGQRNCALTCHLATTCAVPTPSAESNVEVLTGQSGLTFGRTAVFRCSEGYTALSGDTKRVCNADGSLSGAPLQCDVGALRTEVSCTVPVPAPEDNVEYSATSEIDVNTAVTYTCKEGHTHDTGNMVRACSAEGSLVGFPPKCRPIQCDVPAPKYCDNAVTESGSKVAYNEVVTYTCLSGYTLLVGNLSRVCTHEAVLTGTSPMCKEIQCSVPLPPPASNVIRESPALVDVGIQAYYSCLHGFILTDGDLERTCSSDGSLLGNSPVCTETKCDVALPLQEDNTRRVSAAQVSAGSYAVYECTTGHVVSGQLRLQCQSDGNLDGLPPKCLDGVCSVPTPSTNQHVELVSESQVPVAADATYRCAHGYTLQSGNLVRNCQIGGALSGQEPQCVQIRVCEDRSDDCSVVLNGAPNMCSDFVDYSSDCPATCGNCNLDDITCPVPAPTTGDNTLLLNTTTEMYPGQVAVYTCDNHNYLVSGNLVRACRRDGTLTGRKPTCGLASETTSWVNDIPTIPMPKQTPDIPFAYFGASEFSTIQRSGSVKCWRAYCLKEGDIRFVVLRRGGTFPNLSYYVVGHNNVRCHDDRPMTWCIPQQEQISVDVDDIIGIVDMEGGNIGYMTCYGNPTSDYYGEYNGYSAATNIVAGHTFTGSTTYRMCGYAGVNAQIGPLGQ